MSMSSGGGKRTGDRNATGGDHYIPDRGLGFMRRGDRWKPDRWTVAVGVSVILTPDQIAPLSAWYKADALALSDGTAVASWTDSSGHGNTLTASGTQQPTFKAAIVNGKPVIRFNGTSTYMAVSFATLPQPDSAFYIMKFPAISTTGNMFFMDAATTAARQQMWVGMNNGFWNIYCGANPSTPVSLPAGNFHLFAAVFNSGVCNAYLDNTSWISNGNCGTNSLSGLRVGTDVSPGLSWFTGDIAELGIYNSALSAAQVASLHAYAQNKYSTP